jgi:glycosyltransferase involved in cell wall biosynthesis
MAPSLRAAVAKAAGVEAPGFVDDLEPWYRRASVVLLPVREGAGMLFKTIEALARGLATVGFPEAYRGIARGIDADQESAFLTAADEPAIARAASGLLGEPSARRMLGTRARALAERTLSFEHGIRVLDGSLLTQPE